MMMLPPPLKVPEYVIVPGPELPRYSAVYNVAPVGTAITPPPLASPLRELLSQVLPAPRFTVLPVGTLMLNRNPPEELSLKLNVPLALIEQCRLVPSVTVPPSSCVMVP